MKTTSVSTFALSQTMRYSHSRMQVDLAKAQKEASTGLVADRGLALGAGTSRLVSLERDLERLNGLVDSNALVSTRLSATQKSLSQLATAAQTFLSALTSTASGDASSATITNAAKAALGGMTSILNTSMNGEHLFAGTNTDVRPLNDFTAVGSPSKAAFDAAFQAHFGFTQADPAAASITTAQMDAFIAGGLQTQFLGAGWQANWSNATDQAIVSRIALNETAETSVSIDNDGIRKLAMAAAGIAGSFSETTSGAAKTALVDRAIALVGEALSNIAELQSQTGVIEKRVKDASDRIKTQTELFEKHILDVEGVDPYEASSRVSNLLTQIETSYALTARLQQLSLLKFLT